MGEKWEPARAGGERAVISTAKTLLRPHATMAHSLLPGVAPAMRRCSRDRQTRPRPSLIETLRIIFLVHRIRPGRPTGGGNKQPRPRCRPDPDEIACTSTADPFATSVDATLAHAVSRRSAQQHDGQPPPPTVVAVFAVALVTGFHHQQGGVGGG